MNDPALMNEPLTFHPIAENFPLLEGGEYEAFRADIAANGLQVPILLVDGKVIDGRNRYRACRDSGVELSYQEWDGDDDDATLIALVISLNLQRRHMSASKRAMVAARLKTAYEADARERQGTRTDLQAEDDADDFDANLHRSQFGRSHEQAATALNVSPRLVASASKVLNEGTPELARLVERGQVKVSAAAEVAALPIEQQREIVSEGPKAVKAVVKALRAAEKGDEEKPDGKPEGPKAGTNGKHSKTDRGEDVATKLGFARLWETIQDFLVSLPRRGGIVKLMSVLDRKQVEATHSKFVSMRETLGRCISELEAEHPWLDRT